MLRQSTPASMQSTYLLEQYSPSEVQRLDILLHPEASETKMAEQIHFACEIMGISIAELSDDRIDKTVLIKKQNRKISFKVHPDKNPGKETEYQALFNLLSRAKEILDDYITKGHRKPLPGYSVHSFLKDHNSIKRATLPKYIIAEVTGLREEFSGELPYTNSWIGELLYLAPDTTKVSLTQNWTDEPPSRLAIEDKEKTQNPSLGLIQRIAAPKKLIASSADNISEDYKSEQVSLVLDGESAFVELLLSSSLPANFWNYANTPRGRFGVDDLLKALQFLASDEARNKNHIVRCIDSFLIIQISLCSSKINADFIKLVAGVRKETIFKTLISYLCAYPEYFKAEMIIDLIFKFGINLEDLANYLIENASVLTSLPLCTITWLTSQEGTTGEKVRTCLLSLTAWEDQTFKEILMDRAMRMDFSNEFERFVAVKLLNNDDTFIQIAADNIQIKIRALFPKQKEVKDNKRDSREIPFKVIEAIQKWLDQGEFNYFNVDFLFKHFKSKKYRYYHLSLAEYFEKINRYDYAEELLNGLSEDESANLDTDQTIRVKKKITNAKEKAKYYFIPLLTEGLMRADISTEDSAALSSIFSQCLKYCSKADINSELSKIINGLGDNVISIIFSLENTASTFLRTPGHPLEKIKEIWKRLEMIGALKWGGFDTYDSLVQKIITFLKNQIMHIIGFEEQTETLPTVNISKLTLEQVRQILSRILGDSATAEYMKTVLPGATDFDDVDIIAASLGGRIHKLAMDEERKVSIAQLRTALHKIDKSVLFSQTINEALHNLRDAISIHYASSYSRWKKSPSNKDMSYTEQLIRGYAALGQNDRKEDLPIHTEIESLILVVKIHMCLVKNAIYATSGYAFYIPVVNDNRICLIDSLKKLRQHFRLHRSGITSSSNVWYNLIRIIDPARASEQPPQRGKERDIYVAKILDDVDYALASALDKIQPKLWQRFIPQHFLPTSSPKPSYAIADSHSPHKLITMPVSTPEMKGSKEKARPVKIQPNLTSNLGQSTQNIDVEPALEEKIDETKVSSNCFAPSYRVGLAGAASGGIGSAIYVQHAATTVVLGISAGLFIMACTIAGAAILLSIAYIATCHVRTNGPGFFSCLPCRQTKSEKTGERRPLLSPSAAR